MSEIEVNELSFIEKDGSITNIGELKQQLHRYKQAIEEIKYIAEQEVNTRILFADEKSFCDFNEILKIIQKCEEAKQ